jgi:hypothetical protein
MKIYVVMGYTHEPYEDSWQWNVKAFTQKGPAEIYAERLNAAVAAAVEADRSRPLDGRDATPEHKAAWAEALSLDPDSYHNMRDNRIDYSVDEVELLDSPSGF